MLIVRSVQRKKDTIIWSCLQNWISDIAFFDNTEKVAAADYQQLYDEVKQLNAKRKLYKGHIGLHDMKRCVEAAQELPVEVEF